jgi:hypothetical protein
MTEASKALKLHELARSTVIIAAKVKRPAFKDPTTCRTSFRRRRDAATIITERAFRLMDTAFLVDAVFVDPVAHDAVSDQSGQTRASGPGRFVR